MNAAPGAVSSQKMNPEWVPQDCFVLPIQGKWWCGRCDLRRCLRLTCQGPLGRIADVSFGTDDLCMSLSNFYIFRKRHQSGELGVSNVYASFRVYSHLLNNRDCREKRRNLWMLASFATFDGIMLGFRLRIIGHIRRFCCFEHGFYRHLQ